MLNERVTRVVEVLPQDFEAAIISTEPSRFYLLDFDAGNAGTLLMFADEMVYIIDSRYIEVAEKQVKNAKVVLQASDLLQQIQEELAKRGAKRVLLENNMPIDGWQRLKEKIQNVEFDITNTLSKALLEQRMVKDELELERIRAAQKVADSCFSHILPFIKEGVSEIELMLEMEFFMRSNGADSVSFDIIVAAGPNSSLPHGVPSEYKLRGGDFITLDFGARRGGYCSDMTRTVALGEPSEEKRKVYDTVLQAHLKGIQAAGAGKRGCDVDAVAREHIAQAGYGKYFGHGLGHSIGIQIHEDPRFAPTYTGIVPKGAVMTVEPGIYIPGRFGCRIEDMVLIGEDGCTSMTNSPKELMVL